MEYAAHPRSHSQHSCFFLIAQRAREGVESFAEFMVTKDMKSINHIFLLCDHFRCYSQ